MQAGKGGVPGISDVASEFAKHDLLRPRNVGKGAPGQAREILVCGLIRGVGQAWFRVNHKLNITSASLQWLGSDATLERSRRCHRCIKALIALGARRYCSGSLPRIDVSIFIFCQIYASTGTFGGMDGD
jgi:hypothetical protein